MLYASKERNFTISKDIQKPFLKQISRAESNINQALYVDYHTPHFVVIFQRTFTLYTTGLMTLYAYARHPSWECFLSIDLGLMLRSSLMFYKV